MRVEAKERQVRKPSDSVKETFPEQSGQSRDKAGERQKGGQGGVLLQETFPEANGQSRDKAGERQHAGRPKAGKDIVETFPQCSSGKSRDKAGERQHAGRPKAGKELVETFPQHWKRTSGKHVPEVWRFT